MSKENKVNGPDLDGDVYIFKNKTCPNFAIASYTFCIFDPKEEVARYMIEGYEILVQEKKPVIDSDTKKQVNNENGVPLFKIEEKTQLKFHHSTYSSLADNIRTNETCYTWHRKLSPKLKADKPIVETYKDAVSKHYAAVNGGIVPLNEAARNHKAKTELVQWTEK